MVALRAGRERRIGAVMADAAANDDLVRRFIGAWERRDTAFIIDCFADDGVYHATPLDPIVGKAAIRDFVASFEGNPAGRLKIRNQVASATVVLQERTDHLTMNGNPVVLPIMGTFEMTPDGRIAAWREYFDLGPVREAYSAD
ncbi:MAG TPA: nuclear transport factor 2 family protein [Mycobacteriales bacterium]|jgi:limonene-1,2-epoxide hydrolase|nr:nuclear transport factor 2 family protein [Mycobacteriales bacterium]